MAKFEGGAATPPDLGDTHPDGDGPPPSASDGQKRSFEGLSDEARRTLFEAGDYESFNTRLRGL
eukprot:8047863-Pyramimonas_sp.AAC.1